MPSSHCGTEQNHLLFCDVVCPSSSFIIFVVDRLTVIHQFITTARWRHFRWEKGAEIKKIKPTVNAAFTHIVLWELP